MSQIPKHEPEFVGEGHHREQPRVDFPVPGHSVDIDQLLEGSSRFVGPDV